MRSLPTNKGECDGRQGDGIVDDAIRIEHGKHPRLARPWRGNGFEDEEKDEKGMHDDIRQP